jgi:NTP pyrophosphatase (non-canonical NTP hydrolase)
VEIKETMKEVHKNAIDKGLWETFNLPRVLMLIVSEVTEAMEADRDGRRTGVSVLGVNGWVDDNDFTDAFKSNVKDTIEDELADICMRVFDLAEKMEIDLEQHIKAKMRYNALRQFKHGKKY